MIAIPLPFVVALLLSILAMVIFFRHEKDEQPAFIFLALCAVTTTIVGLRWTTDLSIARFLQPIFASLIPAVAWYCFARAHSKRRFNYWHFLPTVLVFGASLSYPFWRPPIDPVLTILYATYGIALLRMSLKKNREPAQVRLSDVPNALKAERAAGIMLLLSATIDGALALDFGLNDGQHATFILALGHALILPILSISVVLISVSIQSDQSLDTEQKVTDDNAEQIESLQAPTKSALPELPDEEARLLVGKIDEFMHERQVYLDPDLTLDRLARKICIPSRQISAAINSVYKRNVSQVINEYRIAHAQNLLATTDDTITQIYLNSGFQTKSNFNREFSRVTNQTPSAYRREAKNAATS